MGRGWGRLGLLLVRVVVMEMRSSLGSSLYERLTFDG